MSRFSAVPQVAFVVILSLLVAASTLGQQPSDYVEGEVIIKFRPATPPNEVSDLEAELGAVVLNRFDSIQAQHWKIQNMSVQQAIDTYDGDGRIEYIEPNYFFYGDQVFPNDPRFPEMWGLHNTGQTGGLPDADIDAPEGWELETGDEVLVGVIDTGTDWHHEDLADNIYINPGEIPGNGIDDDGNGFVDDVRGWDFVNNDNDPFDDAGHGTHTSGTVGAVGNNGIGVVGVSWNVKILPIKFLNAFGTGTTANAIRSVEYATLMGVNLTNNSWGGGGFSAALRDAIQDAGNHGILFVAAAGNSGVDNDVFPHYPSSYDLDNIIAVANTNHNDQLSGTSNWGATSVDLGAPGSSILSTIPGSGYGTASGTSMASPHVAGAASLLWSAAPAMTHLEVKAAILAGVDPIAALSGRTVSGGRLNIYNVLSVLDSIPPGKVRDLAVTSTSSNTATLSWTATGDDSSHGTATRYDVRYSKSQIYWSNFDDATPVPDPPTPQPSGSPESFEVWGLDFNTSYSFALKVYDEQDNVSWISNLPGMATTLGVPQLGYAPASFTDALPTGGTSTQILTIENTAEGTLDFWFTGMPGWLSTNPETGRVPAGQSEAVEVIFDATGLAGGVHSSHLTVQTNDPSQTTVGIPVTLNVTNAPDIAVSPERLDFGPVYVGLTPSMELTVTNIGVIPLNVSGVGIDNPEFGVETSAFVVPASGSHVLTVEYSPVSVGPVTGTLSISSDDPDHPVLDVSLAGAGVDPPVLSVSPGSFSDSLYTGGSSSHLMTIANLGGSDLVFEIATEVRDLAAAVETRLNIPTSDGDFPRGSDPPSIGVAPRSGGGAAPSSSPSAAAGGGSSFATDTQYMTFLSFDLGVPEVLNSIAPAPNFIWLGGFARGDNAFVYAVNDLNQFMEIDTTTGAQTVLGTLSPWGGETFTGMATDPTDGAIYLSSTNIGSSSLYLLDVNGVVATRIGSIGFEGIIAIAVDDQGVMYAHDIVSDELVRIDKTTGSGTAVGSLGFDANYGQGMAFDPVSGELMLAAFNNATSQAELRVADRTTGATTLLGVLGSSVPGGTVQLGWLGIPGGAAWLLADPASGTVPPGTSVDVTVTFDAEALYGGDYSGDIIVSTADPLNADVIVPAFLHVTGAPDIAVSETLLDFGQVFIGGVETLTLGVRNAGTDALSITDIGTDHPDYSVDLVGFDLDPGQSRDVVVSFAPTSAAVIPGALTIESDDPDEPVLTVELSGEGLVPPVVSVDPASLSDSLFTGESSMQMLAVSNNGGSDLEFEIFVENVDSTVLAMSGITFAGQTRTRDYPYEGVSSGGAYRDQLGGENSLQGVPTAEAVRFESHSPTAALTVLYFTDLDNPAERVGEQALVNLGVTFSGFVGDYDGFVAELQTGAWDVALYESAAYSRDISPLVDYVADGGRLISSYWLYDAAFAAAMEATYVSSISQPLLVSRWETHPVFASPNSVPDLEPGPDDHWFDNGDRFEPAGGAVALGGYTPTPTANEAAIVLGNSGRTILNGMVFEDYLPIDGDGDGKPDIVELVENEILFLGLGGWLLVEPTSGTVAPGASADVSVTFDASGQLGGDYLADIVVSNNDPLSPEVPVPAFLHVTGAPDIARSDSLLDYGEVFIGGTAVADLVVENVGTDLLVVSDIDSDHPDYSVDVTSFNLNPNESQIVHVSFSPAAAAVITGTLSITSNDPDEPVVGVALVGEGLEPPVVGVDPSSLSDSLYTGEYSSHALTISNSGGSDLEFSVRAEQTDSVTAQQLYTLGVPGTAHLASDGAAVSPPPSFRTTGIEATLDELTDVHIMWDRSHGQDDVVYWSTIVSDVTARGATVTENFEPVTSSLLAEYDIVWLTDMSPWAPDEITALGDWVRSGGAVLIESDQAVNVVNDILAEMGAGVVYSTTEAGSGLTTNVFAHETTKDVDTCWAGGPLASLGGVDPPAGRLVDDNGGRGLAAYGELDLGRLVAISDELFGDFALGSADNQIFGNQVVDWLAGGVGWLAVEPTEGTVAPGASLDLTVTFDAEALFGGDYSADVVVVNNDPLSPEVPVQAFLHVTGAPDIAWSDSLLDYGQVFVGATVVDTLVVENAGTDLLVVSDISSDHPDYTVGVTGFSLNPNERQVVEVSFSPATAAVREGTLTIESNDPDEPVVGVALAGEGLVPPVIGVDPSSLSDSLFTGDVSTQTMTIDNRGGSDLQFGISVTNVIGPLATAQALQERMSENWSLRDPSQPAAQPTNAPGGEAPLAGTYTGTHLQFGITDYGEIMPYQYPVANEHLAVGSYLSGYTVAYRQGGSDNVAWASYGVQFGIVPVSFVELENNETKVVVEVVTQTADNRLQIKRTFAFLKSDKYIRVTTQLSNTSGSPLDDVVFKSFADWDVDMDFEDDNWDYDFASNMVYAWDVRYCTIAAQQVPDLMDIHGWDDYTRRETIVDYPTGPVLAHDGLEILHFELGDLADGGNTRLVTAFVSADDLSELQSIVGGAVSEWLSVDPSSGTVPPGMSMEVDVTFDAMGLVGGGYNADVVVTNNDPLTPQVTVPAFMDVTGAPDIAWSDSLLDYGQVFIGGAVGDTLRVSNLGSDVLTVSDVSSDLSDYTVDVSDFVLAPGEQQDIEVTFAPEAVGDRNGSLTITSDDPDEPTVVVALAGQGLVPPVIAVSPDSLSEDLLTGQVTTQTMSIDNSGGSDLTFGISFANVSSAAVSMQATKRPATSVAAAPRTADAAPADLDPDESAGQVYDVGGGVPPSALDIILTDDFEDGDFDGWQDAGGTGVKEVTDATAADGTVYSFHEYNAPPGHFDGVYQEFGSSQPGYIGFYIRSGSTTHSDAYVVFRNSAGYERIFFFARASGFLYCNADIGGDETVPYEAHRWYHIEFKNIDFVASTFDYYVDEVLVKAGIPFRYGAGGDFYRVDLYSFTPAAEAWWDQIFVSTGEEPQGWIAADPVFGTVPAGTTVDIEITFDATRLNGGDYNADIVVENNDPVNPAVTVPAHLHVTGAPDIAVSDSALTFGALFIGVSESQTIEVSNAGTDLLTVSDVAADLPDYTVDVTAFSLAPGETREVEVTFTPTVAGAREGTLTIASDDPDEPAYEVSVAGEGVELPEIAVHPDSLADDLYVGDMSVHTLTISNPGGSDLEFTIQTTETTAAPPPPAAAAGMADGASRSSRGGDVAVRPVVAARDATKTAAEVPWLGLSQAAGTVPAGGSVDISVTFDATALIGGEYSADITISTNIPGHPGVVVPATLSVTGAPNIAVSDSLLEFGTVYIGYPQVRNFVVSNNGTDVLTVSDITADQAAFTALPTSFQLPVGDDQLVEVTYDPTEVGAVSAVLTVSSDDPDESAVTVDLEGEALDPPVVGVSVDSIDVTVPLGDTVVETFFIDNSGGSDLSWAVEAGFRADAPLLLAGAAVAPGSEKSGPAESKTEASSSSAIQVMWYGDHGLGGIDYWSIIIADIAARGATVTQSSDPITPSLLSGVDILWFGNTTRPLTAAERAAIVDWVNAGGNLLLESDADDAITTLSHLLADLGAGLNYFSPDGRAGITPFISPHVTTADVEELFLLAPAAQLYVVGAPGGLLFTDLVGAPMGAYSEVGDGRIVALSDQMFHDVAIGQSDNRLFGNQVFSWLALGGYSWLKITPPTGTLAAGEDVEVSLEVDASILPVGEYDLNLDVLSDDPATPTVTVPLHVVVDSTVTITGAGDDAVPNVHRLHPNYPNPFNPTTTIRYDLPAPQNVHLVVYNVRGERVRVLVDGHQPAGRHDVVWDGRNSNGESVASGVYLYKIVAGEFVRTRKMTLLK